jgi:putative FmdB family regulatory protein
MWKSPDLGVRWVTVPVYEWRCRACGHRLEAVQPMGSGPPGACPECGGELRRVYGRVAVRFSGWGFSRTDDLLPEERRSKRDYKALKEKADEISESD